MAPKKPKPKPPVEVKELKDAILKMIVNQFGNRQLTWETVEQALTLVNFEVKQAAMFAPATAAPE